VLAYAALARAAATYLRRGQQDAATYLTGSLGAGDAIYGLSDIDVLVVAPGKRVPRRRVRNRLFDAALCEEGALRDTLAASAFDYGLGDGGAIYFGRSARRPVAGMRHRPGLGRPAEGWRRIGGPDRRPPVPEPDPQQRRVAVWHELQWWWRYAFSVCADPSGPRTAHLCLKLVAEPVRAWLWLAHGEAPRRRRDALERGLWLIPDEEDALRLALELDRAMTRSPEPPLAGSLAALTRLSARIARRIVAEAESAGGDEVELDWDGELALTPHADAPGLLPLADWRALAIPRLADEALMPLEGDPREPAAVAQAAARDSDAVHPLLRTSDLLVLPTLESEAEGTLRTLQCRVTDPVSFALVEDRRRATFPAVRGWSALDVARRAVAEHRAWLRDRRVAPSGYLIPAAAPPGALEVSRLLTAARAALFLESVIAGSPELALSVTAVARRLGPAGEDACAAYRASLRDGLPCRAPSVVPLRDAVASLPGYADPPRLITGPWSGSKAVQSPRSVHLASKHSEHAGWAGITRGPAR
jgi:hypothetical protein